MTEVDLPPMDTIDGHLMQTAGDTGETVTAVNCEVLNDIFNGPPSGQPRSSADFGSPHHLLTEEVSSQHPTPESELSSTVNDNGFPVETAEKAPVTFNDEPLQEISPQ